LTSNVIDMHGGILLSRHEHTLALITVKL